MNINELVDSIFDELMYSNSTEPLGKIKKPYPGATPSDSDEYFDYTTHRPASVYNTRSQQPIESVIKEQEEGEENNRGRKEKTTSNTDSFGGIEDGEKEEEEFDSSEIGKIYELKKIFSRLVALESFLSDSTDENLLKLSSYVSEAVNLFKLVVENVDEFIDDLDKIIVLFYDFLMVSYKLVKKFYDQKRQKDEQKGAK